MKKTTGWQGCSQPAITGWPLAYKLVRMTLYEISFGGPLIHTYSGSVSPVPVALTSVPADREARQRKPKTLVGALGC